MIRSKNYFFFDTKNLDALIMQFTELSHHVKRADNSGPQFIIYFADLIQCLTVHFSLCVDHFMALSNGSLRIQSSLLCRLTKCYSGRYPVMTMKVKEKR